MATVFQRLGPFEILEEIGRGGMAVVFLATDTRHNRRVALKIVRIGSDREAREILEAERLGAQLQEQFSRVCRHVPALYEYGTEGPYFYIAMEYLEGQNLSDAISGGPMQPDRAVAVAIELCRVLELAHSFGPTIAGKVNRSLIHGDLKPRNVRITTDNQIKVLDFGIAKALSLSRKVTRNDFGSIAYLSPERLESCDIDAYADFWAVGVLLYEMVGGVQPFQAPDTRRLEKRILSRRSPEPLHGRCPVGLQAVVAKLLGPYPSDRYGTANAIREDLERFTSERQTEAERQGWPTRASDEPPTRRTRPAVDIDEEATRRTSALAQDPTLVTFRQVDEAGMGAVVPAIPKTTPLRKWLLRAVLLILVLALVGNELRVAAAAGRLARTMPSQQLEGLAGAWSRYDALAQRSATGLGVMALKRSLTQQTLALAERLITTYRTPVPVVWEAQWTMAREALARAVTLAPGDARLKAALRYCEGHLHRINGEARKSRKQTLAAREELTQAVTAFREAAELRPDWPDPFLGLARTFIQGLEDVDRGADALNQARRRGYPPGERETTLLAEGHRTRGDTLARIARKLAGMPQEQEHLCRAVEAYRQALTLYGEVVSLDVVNSIRVAQRAIKRLEERLAGLTDTPCHQSSGPPS